MTPCSQSRCANRTALHPADSVPAPKKPRSTEKSRKISECKDRVFFLYCKIFSKNMRYSVIYPLPHPKRPAPYAISSGRELHRHPHAPHARGLPSGTGPDSAPAGGAFRTPAESGPCFIAGIRTPQHAPPGLRSARSAAQHVVEQMPEILARPGHVDLKAEVAGRADVLFRRHRRASSPDTRRCRRSSAPKIAGEGLSSCIS